MFLNLCWYFFQGFLVIVDGLMIDESIPDGLEWHSLPYITLATFGWERLL